MYFSADSHVQEPTDLWTRQLPVEDHYRAPVFHRFTNRTKQLTANGVINSISPDYVRPKIVSHGPVDWDNADLIGPDDVDGYLRDLAMDNVWGAMLHPNAALFLYDIDDTEFTQRCPRIYNDHVAEIYQSVPLYPMALVPLNDVDTALEEIDHAVSLGLRGLQTPTTPPPGETYFTKKYDPLWEAAQRHGLPIAMHIGTGLRRQTDRISFSQSTGTNRWPEGHPDRHTAIVARKTEIGGFGGYDGGPALQSIAHLVGGGILERFPDLHFIFVEVGARWLLNSMDTMDTAWDLGPGFREVIRIRFNQEGNRNPDRSLDELNLVWPYPMKPSDYVRRQIHVTFMYDWVALRNRTYTGASPLIWGNDYPHPEGCWPKSAESIEIQAQRAQLNDEEKEAIFGGTVSRLLRVEQPSFS